MEYQYSWFIHSPNDGPQHSYEYLAIMNMAALSEFSGPTLTLTPYKPGPWAGFSSPFLPHSPPMAARLRSGSGDRSRLCTSARSWAQWGFCAFPSSLKFLLVREDVELQVGFYICFQGQPRTIHTAVKPTQSLSLIPLPSNSGMHWAEAHGKELVHFHVDSKTWYTWGFLGFSG